MKLIRAFAIAAVLTAVTAEAKNLKDATGEIIHVPDHPVRIITLAPSVAELAAEFLGSDLQRIVGVSESTDYPPALGKVESIGPYNRFNLEKVAGLKPDLVLATIQGNAKDQVIHLRELGIPVFVLATGNFSEVEEAMSRMPELLGLSEKASAVVQQFKRKLAEIHERGKNRSQHPKVLLQLDDSPLVVAGGDSFLSEELKAVGAENVYGDSKIGYPRPSLEDVLKRDPDFIFIMALGSDPKPFTTMASKWTQYPRLQAVREKRVRVIIADALLRPSMRLLEGLAVLERTLYGKN